MRTHSLAVVVLLLLSGNAQSAEKLSAKSVRDILEKATTFELYSLDPTREEEKGFHGHAILGKTLLKKADVQKKVGAALYQAITDSDGTTADCFLPRHGIRALHKGKTVDVVICFQCYQAKFLVEGAETTEALLRTPQPLFDKLLKEAGVPLAPKAGK